MTPEDEDFDFEESLTPEQLREAAKSHEGYSITPKGYIALTLMERFGVKLLEADEIARKIEDDIFLGGYIYIHHSRIRPVDD